MGVAEKEEERAEGWEGGGHGSRCEPQEKDLASEDGTLGSL